MRLMMTKRSLVSVIILIAFVAIECGTAHNMSCENISTANESNPSGRFDQAGALFNMSRLNESISAYDRAIELNQSYVEAWDHKGDTLRKMGKYNEAIAAYNIAIKLDPTRGDSWYNEGVALFDQGRYNESITAYDRAIDLNPEWTLPWYGKGESLDQSGLHEDALEAYDKAVELDLTSAKQNKKII